MMRPCHSAALTAEISSPLDVESVDISYSRKDLLSQVV